jgi:hypothetical protein
MVINIDTVVDDETLNAIGAIDGVHNPKYVNLTV